MTLNKLNPGIIRLATRVAGLLIRHRSRQRWVVPASTRAVSLAAALFLLGIAEVQGDELLETLVPPLNGSRVIGTVPLQQGDTYRIVLTGVLTFPSLFPNPPTVCDALFCLFPGSPDPVFSVGGVSFLIGAFGLELFPSANDIPPFDPVGHRYERTFVSERNGLLSTFLRFTLGTPTGTIRVELFGERGPDTCAGKPATIEAVPGVPIPGTPGNDVIIGTEGDDQLFGRGGNDIICGLAGNDIILGDEGRDRLIGGPGDDQILGGGDDARDILHGDDGQDRLGGGKGHDILDGGPGVDRMIGGPDNDTLFVNGVAVVINTDDGTFTRQGDVLLGGPGFDTADYSQLPRPVRVDLRLGNTKQRGSEILNSIEVLRGTAGDDRLIGNDQTNDLRGEGGNDRLDGRGLGFDRLDGGAAFDTCIVDPEDLDLLVTHRLCS